MEKDKLVYLRKKYKTGTKVRLISMDDPQTPKAGTIGTVTYVDDIGSIHVHWENGSSLALITEVDKFEILS